MLAEARASAIEQELEIEQLRREIERLELRLEDLSAGSGVADVQHAKVRKEKPTTGESAAREPLPTHLSREDRVLKSDSICPECEGAMQCLGEDVSEQLARVAAMFKVIRTIRHKTVCPACAHIAQPPMPGLQIERSIARPSLLADILVSKYVDHAPLYRQSEIAARDGMTLNRASMGRRVGQCEALCRPLNDALRRYTMAGTKLHADDTPIPVLAPGNKKTKIGRLWVYLRDDSRSGSAEPAAVWFVYSCDRKGIRPQTHLAGFEGIPQADTYRRLRQIIRKRQGPRGCLLRPRAEKILRDSREHTDGRDPETARDDRRVLRH